MRAVTVTIGRNIGDKPMDAEDWSGFTYRTRRAIEGAGVDLWATAPYKGLWEGVSEDAIVFYGALPGVKESDDNRRVRGLRENLRNLASEYGQEAVGLTVGDNELIEAFA